MHTEEIKTFEHKDLKCKIIISDVNDKNIFTSKKSTCDLIVTERIVKNSNYPRKRWNVIIHDELEFPEFNYEILLVIDFNSKKISGKIKQSEEKNYIGDGILHNW